MLDPEPQEKSLPIPFLPSVVSAVGGPQLVRYIHPSHMMVVSIDKIGDSQVFGIFISKNRPDYSGIRAGLGRSLSRPDNEVVRAVGSCQPGTVLLSCHAEAKHPLQQPLLTSAPFHSVSPALSRYFSFTSRLG